MLQQLSGCWNSCRCTASNARLRPLCSKLCPESVCPPLVINDACDCPSAQLALPPWAGRATGRGAVSEPSELGRDWETSCLKGSESDGREGLSSARKGGDVEPLVLPPSRERRGVRLPAGWKEDLGFRGVSVVGFESVRSCKARTSQGKSLALLIFEPSVPASPKRVGKRENSGSSVFRRLRERRGGLQKGVSNEKWGVRGSLELHSCRHDFSKHTGIL